MKHIINLIKSLSGFGEGHERTNRAKKNIFLSIILKGFNIAIGLILVPMTINYLNPTKYGIWITLTSFVAWFSFFDIGLGNGLRNRFAESIAVGNHTLAKTYVSTTYAVLTLFMIIFLCLFLILNIFIDWGFILNTGGDPTLKIELSRLAIIVFVTFGMTFVLNLITVILNADQRPAISSLFDLIGKSLSLIFIYFISHIVYGSLLALGLIYCIISPLVLGFGSFWLFWKRYRIYRPSFKSIDFSKTKDLLNLGIKFFIIQVAAIFLYQTNNIIITQLFGPAMVTPYNISFKYFSILLMGFMILLSPFWSAFTEAWIKYDLIWINGIMKKLIKSWFLLMVFGIIMLIFSSYVYKIWIGNRIVVPFSLSLLLLIWILLNSWNGIFVQFLNGTGKLNIQLYLGIITALINVPLSIILGKLIGIEGLLISNVFFALIQAIVLPFHFFNIIKTKLL